LENQGNAKLVRRATRSGLPPLGNYLRETYRFRTFALRWSAGERKALHFETFLGRVWHFLNPFIFGLIYFVFVGILSAGGGRGISRLAFIVSNLYVWLFFTTIISSAVNSVKSGGGGVLANSSIPRVIIPIASTVTAANYFIRSIITYIPLHLLAKRGLHVEMLAIPLLIILTCLFGFGLGLIFATLNVYIRDVSRLLPHFLRLWLYLSPGIWEYTRVLGDGTIQAFARLNPMFSGMTSWTLALGGSLDPTGPTILGQLGIFAIWSVAMAIAGFLFFVSREDEFAVRN